MNVPDNLKYTDQHEWVKIEGDTGTVGITDFAQNALGEITYVELPTAGQDVSKGDEVGSVESSKAASSIYAPAGGMIIEVNEALEDQPELVNGEPYAGGWMYKLALSNPGEVTGLMDAAAYEELAGKEE